MAFGRGAFCSKPHNIVLHTFFPWQLASFAVLEIPEIRKTGRRSAMPGIMNEWLMLRFYASPLLFATYAASFGFLSKYAFVSLAATPLRTISEMQFGIAISPFVMSAIVHTWLIVKYGPMKTAMI